jgi:hypothetical protein
VERDKPAFACNYSLGKGKKIMSDYTAFQKQNSTAYPGEVVFKVRIWAA